MNGCLYLYFCITFCVVLGQEVPEGTSDFKYSSNLTRSAAKKVVSYEDDLDRSVVRYLDELYQYYSQSGAVDADTLTAMMTSCYSSLPSNFTESANEAARETVVEIQTLDYLITLDQETCSSRSKNGSNSCEEFLKKVGQKLNMITSNDKLDKLKVMCNTAYDKIVEYLKTCVAQGIYIS